VTEFLTGSPGVITGAEWLGILVVGVIFAIAGGVAGWFVAGAAYRRGFGDALGFPHTRREGRGGDDVA
jgi:hypothetical protein